MELLHSFHRWDGILPAWHRLTVLYFDRHPTEPRSPRRFGAGQPQDDFCRLPKPGTKQGTARRNALDDHDILEFLAIVRIPYGTPVFSRAYRHASEVSPT